MPFFLSAVIPTLPLHVLSAEDKPLHVTKRFRCHRYLWRSNVERRDITLVSCVRAAVGRLEGSRLDKGLTVSYFCVRTYMHDAAEHDERGPGVSFK